MIYRRPETTVRVLEAIRQARPSRLFVAADGPSEQREDLVAACAEARRVVDEGIDWPCHVEKFYRTENRGLRIGFPEAITWFFGQVEEGIILEDDTLPCADFFRYSTELLERYRHDERVWAVCGTNASMDSVYFEGSSYGFSYANHPWGWASWRRAWKFYEGSPVDLDGVASPSRLLKFTGSEYAARYWSAKFRKLTEQKIQSWYYLWKLSLWRHEALAIVPSVNLISNIGYGEFATHTKDTTDPMADRKTAELKFPLLHPSLVADDSLYTNDVTIRDVRKSEEAFEKRRQMKRLLAKQNRMPWGQVLKNKVRKLFMCEE